MSDEKKVLTPKGYKKLEQELEQLKEKRKEISEKIGEAVKLGDLSENAEYHEAKDEQGLNEARISEIEHTLKNAEVYTEEIDTDIVQIGNSIKVETGGKQFEYKIVGSNEADPAHGYISNESPIGEAFLGHRVGDEVEFEAPAGTVIYRILEIS